MNIANLKFLTVLLLVSTFVLTATGGDVTPVASPPSPGGCADSVISMSPCLPYVSAPPNDLSDEPSSQCCDIFNGAFVSGEAECLCYLVRQSTLLGFPLNATRLLSLSDLCSGNNTTHANTSLDLICSVSPTLPPMVSPTKKSPRSDSGSIARHSPPPPQTPLHRPPPSAITNTKPRPANNPFGQNATKPSTSEQSNYHNDVELVILIYIYLVLPIIFYHYIAAAATTLLF